MANKVVLLGGLINFALSLVFLPDLKNTVSVDITGWQRTSRQENTEQCRKFTYPTHLIFTRWDF